jgi:hypothetical protein
MMGKLEIGKLGCNERYCYREKADREAYVREELEVVQHLTAPLLAKSE